MHAEAFDFVASAVAQHGPFNRVTEYGSLDINGSVRPLFGDCDYLGIDLAPGRGVDLVADCTTWTPQRKQDCVVTCEALEHYEDWPAILSSAHRALRKRGLLIATAAGPGRSPHSGFDGAALRPGEHYANIDPDRLAATLADIGFTTIRVDTHGFDVRATARKG